MSDPSEAILLSKGKLMAWLQCPRRLHFAAHDPALARVDADVEARMEEGRAVGRLARRLYGEDGIDIEARCDTLAEAWAETRRLLAQGVRQPLFEAAFAAGGAAVRVDVLLPDDGGWRLVEIKAGTSLKPHYVHDCAIQAWVCRQAGLDLRGVALGHVDNGFVYPGGGDYRGLIAEVDLSEKTASLAHSVPGWIAQAVTAASGERPNVPIGAQCRKPHPCPFRERCWPSGARYPVTGLGGRIEKHAAFVLAGYEDIRDVPANARLSATQRRIRRVTMDGSPEILPSAGEAMRALSWPRYYLDFETIGPAIPVWPGTRPYRAEPVQYSVHVEHAPGSVTHDEFLDLSGEPPMRELTERLLDALGETGPVLVYSSYEKRILNQLARDFPDLSVRLHSVIDRLEDLCEILKANYYHPDMLGSWSIKAVLPTVAPQLCYEDLGEICQGQAASAGFLEAIDPATSAARRDVLRRGLLDYCRFDTLAMLAIVERFR